MLRMKKIKTTLLIVATITFMSFTAVYIIKPNTAEVSQIEGLYVFTDSKPVAEYEYLGTVKNNLSLRGSQYTSIRNKLISKAKKEYPNADAVIMSFSAGGTDKADVVKFK